MNQRIGVMDRQSSMIKPVFNRHLRNKPGSLTSFGRSDNINCNLHINRSLQLAVAGQLNLAGSDQHFWLLSPG